MKTSDFIKLLKQIDPDGEGEVCVDNMSVYDVSVVPSYWDGILQKVYIKNNIPEHIDFTKDGYKLLLEYVDVNMFIYQQLSSCKDPIITGNDCRKLIIKDCYDMFYNWPVKNNLFVGPMKKYKLNIWGYNGTKNYNRSEVG